MYTYLAHHGILGQKWGLRRFQNEDGTLTDAGRARYAQVAASKFKKKLDTKVAVETYTQLASNSPIYANAKRKRAEELRNKASEQVSPDKKSKLEAKAARNEIAAEANEYLAKHANTRLDQISKGEFEAGKDFFIQRDVNVWPIITPWFVWFSVSGENSVIERDGKAVRDLKAIKERNQT